MNNELIDALEACLQRMEHGEPLDSVLAGYPRLAGQLHPLLMTAARARSAGREPYSPTVLSRQSSLGISLAADLRQGKIRRPVFRHFCRPVVTIFLVIVFLVMSSNGILVASAKSIPGDTLYPLKRSVESTQLGLISDAAQRQVLEHSFSERRVDETKILIIIRRIEDVEFTGVVTSQSGDKWLISGIPVVLPYQVTLDQQIQIGDDVDVHGSTNTDGNVVAMRLSLASDSGSVEGQPVVSPTSTPTPKMSGESDSTTSAESSLTPSHSDEAGSRVIQSKSTQSARFLEGNASGETSHSSRSNAGSEGDN